MTGRRHAHGDAGSSSPAIQVAPGVAPVPGAAAPKAAPRAAAHRSEVLYFAIRDVKFLTGAAILLVFALVGIFGPTLRPGDPDAFVGGLGSPPDSQFWFGTTIFGQDVLTQLMHSVGPTLMVGVLGGGIAAILGMAVGFIAGYRGGIVDELLNMVTNVVLVIPTLALLLVLSAYLQSRGIVSEAVFIGFTSWPWAARAIRAQTFTLRTREFVDLARLSGTGSLRIIFAEIAPNMASYLLLVFILLFGGAILIAASLDFIGLGPTSGHSLGLMMYNAVAWGALQLGMWWWFIPPGLAITVIVGALYVTNVGLDEIFNPRLREL